MKAMPITLRAANAYVEKHHRHSKPVQGHFLSVSVAVRGEIVGVAILGRPVARKLQDGLTCEITRCCTDGHSRACSCLYGKCVRIARELGYVRVVTYTKLDEPGTSLRAAGFTAVSKSDGGQWSVPSRPRKANENDGPKMRWERMLK